MLTVNPKLQLDSPAAHKATSGYKSGGAAYAGTFGAWQAPVQAQPLSHTKKARVSAGLHFIKDRRSLFLEHHFLGGAVFAAAHSVLVDTGRDGFAGAVASIPVDLIVSCSVVGAAEAAH